MPTCIGNIFADAIGAGIRQRLPAADASPDFAHGTSGMSIRGQASCAR